MHAVDFGGQTSPFMAKLDASQQAFHDEVTRRVYRLEVCGSSFYFLFFLLLPRFSFLSSGFGLLCQK